MFTFPSLFHHAALKISLFYLLLGILWITVSDGLVDHYITNSKIALIIHTTKGVGYVVVTSILLYILIKIYFNKNEQIHEKLIDEKKQRIEVLTSSRKILESISDAFFSVDETFAFTYMNNEAKRLLGRKTNENLIGKNLWKEFPDLMETKIHSALLIANQEYTNQSFEEFYKSQSSWFDVRVFPSGKGVSVFFLNVNERKKHEAELEHLLQFDYMTGLPNRFSLTRDAEDMLAKAVKRESKLALIVIDINRFKTINDTFGHHIGDELLKQVAKRLESTSEQLPIQVYRNGGDEFSLLYQDVQSFEILNKVLASVVKELSKPFELNGQHIVVDVSVGISIFPDDSVDAHTLFQHAAMAMYLAKEEAGVSIQFYLNGLSHHIDSFRLEHDLTKALENNEIYLQYQPRYDLKKKKVVGVEALVRWNHPINGRIPPLDFIPIAEKTGYIIRLGEWIIAESFSQLKEWEKQGIRLEMSINLSANQIRKSNFVDDVRMLLDKYSVEPNRIEFEITETVLMYHIETSLATIKELKKLGCRIALDDFGTGYSSLNYLKTIPTDYVKIDRSFMSEVPGNKVDSAIVETIIHLARQLGIYVIAEGIETEEMIDFLKKHKCDGIQGYFISRPVDSIDVPSLINRSYLIS
ncbi:EAL domain-containing protein [Salipaludibacillus sp. HK11]|uniref:sensor domain-containing protein n=1 Tax=Salipaludibacillus sp. HK11 TaxID=3394320 RepID=UPI0039FBCC80